MGVVSSATDLDSLHNPGWYFYSGLNSSTDVLNEDGVLFVINAFYEDKFWLLKFGLGTHGFGVAYKRGSETNWTVWKTY